MVLQGKRIILRKFQIGDAREYLKLTNDYSIRRYVPFACPDDLNESIELLENYSNVDFKNDFYFLITDKKTKKIIGCLQSFKTTSNTLDTTYFIFPDYRGKGYCLEALKVFINYISTHTNYSLLEFTIRKNNKSSQKIMKKLSVQKAKENKNCFFYQYQIKSAK